jgi:hypothetical protein
MTPKCSIKKTQHGFFMYVPTVTLHARVRVRKREGEEKATLVTILMESSQAPRAWLWGLACLH